MSLSRPKKALIGTALLVIFTLAIFSHFLTHTATLDMYDRLLLRRSNNGKLVARSQWDFHHIVEQWVPPKRQGRPKLLKERFIEDGRVIKEDIEYPENENEIKGDPFILHFIIGDENKHVQTGKAHDKSTPHWSVTVTAERKEEKELQQPPAESDEKGSLVEHKSPNNQNLTSLHSNNSTEKGDDIVDSQKPSENFKIEPKLVGEQSLAEVDSGLKAETGIHSKLSSSNSTEKKDAVVRSQKPKRNFKFENKTPVGEQAQEERDRRVKAETGIIHSKPSSSSHGKLLNKTDQRIVAKTPDSKLKKDRDVRNAERYAVFDPAKEQMAVVENGGKESHPPGFVRVVSLDSHRHETVKYVQLSNDQQVRSGSSQSIKHNDLPLQYSDKAQPPLSQTDVDSDPKYAHLPPSVRKKIAALRKERLKRLERAKLIREKCEGMKYCLRVQYKERHLHDNCFHSAIKRESEGVQLKPCTCKLYPFPTTYVNGQRVEANFTRPRVALVSLPGSGNTWVRGLLELATGYCTGSMWCDPTLRAMQFCAEGLRTNTLVVKNHDRTIRWLREKRPENATELNKPMFSSAIFVHRNPYEANIAEWNRALGFQVHNATKHNRTVAGIGYYDDSNLKDQHTITFGKEAFGLNAGWNKTIYLQMEIWETMVNHLVINNTGSRPVLLVKYEDLKRDTCDEVKRMVNFIGEEMLPGAEQMLRDGFQTFHRNHNYTFDHYTREQKEYINSVIMRVAKQLELNRIDYLHVRNFLREN